MSERRGLTHLAADARAALHKLIAGIRVVDVPPIPDTEPVNLDPSILTVVSDRDCQIHGESCEVGFVVQPEFIRHLNPLSGNEIDLDPSIEAIRREMEIVDSRDARSHSVSCDFTQSEIMSESTIPVPESIDFMPDKPECGKVVEIATRGFGDARRDMDAIYRQPIVINPVPWGMLDREFIVRSWEHLRERSKMELGADPGRNLEMSAVFLNVDYSYVRKVRFDSQKRKLHLFVRRPAGARSSNPHTYAIIIGLVRGTGKVLQVAMPMDD